MSFFNFSYSRFVFLFISLFILPAIAILLCCFCLHGKRSVAAGLPHKNRTIHKRPSMDMSPRCFPSCLCLCHVFVCVLWCVRVIHARHFSVLLAEWMRQDRRRRILFKPVSKWREYLHRLSSVNYRENWFRFGINSASINQNRIHSYCIEKVYSCGIIYTGRMIRCVYSAAWAWLMSFNLIGAPFMSVRRTSTWSVCLLSTIHEDRLTGLQSVTSLFQFCVALLYKTPFFLFSFLFQ